MLSCCTTCYLIVAGIIYAAYKLVPKYLLQQKLDRFDKSKSPKDKVILHGTRRSKTVPSGSPFVLKLETYLRMAKIPYEYDSDQKNTFGPKGKTPWITLNGEHVADTELCIQFLSKKFDKAIPNKYSAKELAIANFVRISLEDKMFWQLVMWVFIWPGDGPTAFKKFTKVPWLLFQYVCYSYKQSTWAQGIGRHTKEEIMAWSFRDVRALSAVLGNNKFLLGDQPCTEDAAFFGFVAQFVYGFPATSPYGKLLNDECSNLKDYVIRMKELYYPDWEAICKPN